MDTFLPLSNTDADADVLFQRVLLDVFVNGDWDADGWQVYTDGDFDNVLWYELFESLFIPTCSKTRLANSRGPVGPKQGEASQAWAFYEYP